MKVTKIIALICAFALTTGILSSCGYRISITKKEDDTTVAEITTVPVVQQETAVPTTQEATTSGITVDSAYRTVAMSETDVLALYTDAMNNVKIRVPGFTKKEYQDVFDIEAGSGMLQLANRIMNLVVTELLTSAGDSESTVTVVCGDDLKVRQYFPVFGKDYGCNVTDMSLIKSAVCYTDGATYKIVITVNDALNPEPGESAFGNIMTPVARKNVANGIAEYLVVLDTDQYQFDINYTGNEITCIIDKETMHITSLSQKMIMNVEVNINLDLIIFKTSVVKTKGTIINHLEYSDFKWQ